MTAEERYEPEEALEEPGPLSDLTGELSKPVPEEDEEGKSFELSPEEAEKLRQTMAKLQATMNPRIGLKLPDLLGKSSFLKNYESIAKMGRFTLPESTMKNFTAISRLSEDLSKFGRINLSESALKGVLGKNFRKRQPSHDCSAAGRLDPVHLIGGAHDPLATRRLKHDRVLVLCLQQRCAREGLSRVERDGDLGCKE